MSYLLHSTGCLALLLALALMLPVLFSGTDSAAPFVNIPSVKHEIIAGIGMSFWAVCFPGVFRTRALTTIVILAVRNGFKVKGIAAVSLAAQVIDFISFRDVSDEHFVGYTMNQQHHDPVAALEFRSSPPPATGFWINLNGFVTFAKQTFESFHPRLLLRSAAGRSGCRPVGRDDLSQLAARAILA